ncbi:hypothetical protein EJD97_013361, partial [Solanum chilense]
AQSAVDQQAGGSGSPEPTSSSMWTPLVVSSATTALLAVPPAISTVQELDTPAANSLALIWCASSSTSEALIAASILRRSLFRARALSSARLLPLLACSRGELVESLRWRIGPPTLCRQQIDRRGLKLRHTSL